MTQMIALTDFAAPAPAVEEVFTSDERDEAYRAGFEAGQAAARADQSAIDAGCVAALDSIAFGYSEARRDILVALVPFLRAVADQLVPPLARAAVGARLIEALQAEAEQAVPAHYTVYAPPQRADALTQLLADQGITHADVATDATLNEDAVRVAAGAVERSIDMSRLISDIAPIIESFAAQAEDIEHHG